MPFPVELPGSVVVRDVTMRDGLQDEAPIATDVKVALFQALVDAGVRELELTSFVRPDRVPAMADATALAAATDDVARDAGVRRWALALNRRGAQRALAAGLVDIQYVVSVSDAHSRHNAGSGTEERFAELESIAADVQVVGADLEVTLATAFGCPFDGPVPPDRVVDLAARAVGLGVSAIGLADTIGTAVPTEVAEVTARTIDAVEGRASVGAHLHDTRGLGVANALAAITAGAGRVDASVNALGGCPFAPGASGNVSAEDLVHALEAMRVDTGIDLRRLMIAGRLAAAACDREVEGHVATAGPRFEPAIPSGR